MFDKAPLQPPRNSSASGNTWVVICAIIVLIAIVIVIEVHIHRLTIHSILLA